jgi:PAS domain-containing protein
LIFKTAYEAQAWVINRPIRNWKRAEALETKVDECRLIEQRLMERKKSYRILQENVPVGLFRFSEAGQLLFLNPVARKILHPFPGA